MTIKRVGMVGVATVAAFALSVIGVSTAFAMIESKAEFIKGGSKTKNNFTGKSRPGLAPTLTTSLNTVKCKSDTVTGKISGDKTMSVEGFVVTFKECQATTNGGCAVKSTGAGNVEEIVTAALKGTLGRVMSKEATSEVGLVLEGPGSVFVTIEGTCLTFAPAKITGKIAGEVTPINKSQLTGEVVFEATGNKQKIKKICLLPFGALPCVGTLNEPVAEYFAFEVVSDMNVEELKFEENTEVKAI